MENAQYTLRVLQAFEDEVAGATYFDRLASAYPEQSAFFEKCAALERVTASKLGALIRKYQLTPRTQTTLEERGALDARKEAGSDFRELMHQSIKSYAGYVADFKALEAIGPTEDQPVLTALTAHEVQLIEWMRAQIGS
jgi:hypothetical protein